ncbi:MAG: NAD-dependent malic enzyme [Candidatus Vogelbacteria bacterium CG10_big_fil_rev_8_21_14_0_10_45_14]|uniref:NAD-dependent malic enzyme n=1 Tax=Candidatus Vogelbacteria bacterium CG10_big_fil_rev_8_21_14_0_10_45_14 TaxID=1975042 RepID=A0A2H0RI89_9BACT|nr:MAG: NAD-dependent malic enzyme [Candidatus Vogelbacteria bacterium CG10_big_fil_rev_8_21_14_0_10_45_14]
MSRVARESLALHKKLRGKVGMVSKAPLRNMHDLSVLYTPGMAAVSTYLAGNKIEVGNYTMKSNSVAMISDGSAVLGLGNIGWEGALPVIEGKAVLAKTFAGVDAFPIVLGTQNTDEIVSAIKAIAPTFGGIHLEDISAPRCFEIEERLKKELDIPVMHDDQWGTAIVVVAGLVNALKVVGKKMEEITVVIAGAGAAGTAIAKSLLHEGVGDVVLVDSKGVISKKRTDLNVYKQKLAKITNRKGRTGNLGDAIFGADVFVGVSQPGILSEEMVRGMKEGAIIFAMANPVPEIMPDVAKRAGAAVVATGRSDFPNQINNVLGFPGLWRGALDNGVRKFTPEIISNAAHAIANLIPRPTAHKIIPDAFDKRVVRAVAKAVK